VRIIKEKYYENCEIKEKNIKEKRMAKEKPGEKNSRSKWKNENICCAADGDFK
jgi:hypothetical protein